MNMYTVEKNKRRPKHKLEYVYKRDTEIKRIMPRKKKKKKREEV